MKNILLISLTVALLSSCDCQTSTNVPVDKASIKTEIHGLLTDWHKAAANADLDAYIGRMDSTGYYMGTDAGENWDVPSFAEFCSPYFAKQKTWDFTAMERNVFVDEAGKTAWFNELLKTQMGTCRGSGVLVKSDHGWKIQQYVLSVMIPNDDIDAVMIAKNKNDSIFLSRFR